MAIAWTVRAGEGVVLGFGLDGEDVVLSALMNESGLTCWHTDTPGLISAFCPPAVVEDMVKRWREQAKGAK